LFSKSVDATKPSLWLAMGIGPRHLSLVLFRHSRFLVRLEYSSRLKVSGPTCSASRDSSRIVRGSLSLHICHACPSRRGHFPNIKAFNPDNLIKRIPWATPLYKSGKPRH
jgi:hypothetical protein